jgi:hypothetical protein
VYQVQGNYLDAELLYKRALEIRDKVLPLSHPDIARNLGDLANLQILIERPAESLLSIRRATAILIMRANDQVSTRDADDTRGEIMRSSSYVRQHVRAAWRVKDASIGRAC